MECTLNMAVRCSHTEEYTIWPFRCLNTGEQNTWPSRCSITKEKNTNTEEQKTYQIDAKSQRNRFDVQIQRKRKYDSWAFKYRGEET